MVVSAASRHAQPKAKPEEPVWNKSDFRKSAALKTPYSENLSGNEKIALLSKFWSEIKHNFINFHLAPGLDRDKTHPEFLPKVRARRSTPDYYRVGTAFVGVGVFSDKLVPRSIAELLDGIDLILKTAPGELKKSK